MQDNRPSHIVSFTASIVVGLVLALILMRPFTLPAEGLDASWIMALERGFLEQFEIGRELIFTTGPLGLAYGNLYHPETIGLLLGLQLLIWLAWFVYFGVHPKKHLWLILPVFALLTPIIREHVYLTIPFLGFWACRDKPRWVYGLIWLVAGVLGGVKFTFLVAGIGLLLIADLLSFRIHRHWFPLAAFSFVVGLVGSFMLSGLSLTLIADYWTGSLEVSRGFSQAMAVYGPEWELLTYLAVSFLMWLIIVFDRRPQDRYPRALNHLLLVLGVSYYFFLFTKAGFVRHDMHSLVGWSGLAIMGLFFWQEFGGRRFNAALYLLLGLAGLGIGLWQKQASIPKQLTDDNVFELAADNLKTNGLALIDLAAGDFHNKLTEQRWQALQRLKGQLPELTSSEYDVAPYNLSAFLSTGVGYRPRPVIQGYTTYTPWLIQRNQEALNSKPPQGLIHNIYSIDNRWPTLDDAIVLDVLLRRYDPVQPTAVGFEYKRRQQQRTVEASVIRETEVPLDQWIDIPPQPEFVFAELDFAFPLTERLRTTLYKAPLYWLEAKLAGGQTVRHRIVPAMSRSGFLLSPYITGNQLIRFFPGVADFDAGTGQVTAIRISKSESFSWEAPARVTLKLSGRKYSGLLEQPFELSASAKTLSELAQHAEFNHSHFPVAHGADGLFTHANMRLSLNADSVSGIHFNIGLDDVAWQRGNTDGVLFRLILDDGSQSDPIYQRDLNPVQHTDDRGPQSVSLSFEQPLKGRLIFEFTQKQHADFDWSYLSNVRVTRAVRSTSGG